MENNNKNRIIIIVGIVIVLIFITYVLTVNFSNKDKNEYKQLTTSQQLILLRYGFENISNVRQALGSDIDTGVRVKDNSGRSYAVFRSRHFETGDYGKLFVSPVLK